MIMLARELVIHMQTAVLSLCNLYGYIYCCFSRTDFDDNLEAVVEKATIVATMNLASLC